MATSAIGADFSKSEQGLVLRGPIVAGDYEKLMKYVSVNGLYDTLENPLLLDSPGGSVLEAMKIADFVQRSFMYTIVPSGANCFSSCFILWSSGARRFLAKEGVLGVHRMSLKGKELDVVRTESTLKPLSKGVWTSPASIDTC